MKRIKLMAFLLATPLLMTLGCKKKKVEPEPDPNPPVVVEDYLGTWNGVEQSVIGFLNGDPILEDSYEFEPGELIMIIKDDYTIMITEDHESNEEYTYEKMNNRQMKFKIQTDEDVYSDAIFTVEESNKNVAEIIIIQDNVDVDPSFPPLDMELRLKLIKQN